MHKNIETYEKDCTLLISSCDRYSDLWEPYISLLNRYWPDCPFSTALITEELTPNFHNVKILNLGSNLDWSSLLIKALDDVPTTYVLFTLEDFFIRKKVNTIRILKLFDELKTHNYNMMRLIPRPGPSKRKKNGSEVGSIDHGSDYRVSTQAAFWKVETLRNILVQGESAWAFEVNATNRSKIYDGFVSVWEPALPYFHHVIERGKWFPWEALYFNHLKIGVNLSKRQIMSFGDTLRYFIQKLLGKTAVKIHPKIRLLIKPFLQKVRILK